MRKLRPFEIDRDKDVEMLTRRQWLDRNASAGMGVAMGLLCCGCKSAPLTNRRQLILIPESNEITLGLQSYEQATANIPRSANADMVQRVNRVGQRIAAAAARPDYQWEFRLLATPEQNAFALPGGKVAIHEGILPVCLNEAGLAVVMSHEIAHALARHGGERMSHGIAVNTVQQVGQKLLQSQPVTRQDQFLQAYGVVSKYGVVLPYNRKQESEADEIGLMLMARAGYDPDEAPRFWSRFAAHNAANVPEFLSTHPASETRANALRSLLPQAHELFQQAPVKVGLGDTLVRA